MSIWQIAGLSVLGLLLLTVLVPWVLMLITQAMTYGYYTVKKRFDKDSFNQGDRKNAE